MIGENLKELRARKGLGLNELSRLANVNASYISAIERGEKKNPSTNILNKIAEALGVSADELFKSDSAELAKVSSKSDKKESVDEEFDEEIRAIARNMKNLSQSKRKLLSELVKTMSEEADKALDE